MTKPVAMMLVVLVLGAALYAQGPKAVVVSSQFDFGAVKQGEKIVHQFAIRNSGDQPLLLQSAELNAPGMRVRMKPIVPPGAEATVTIEWDTTRIKGEMVGEAYIYTNDRATPQFKLVVAARVVPPIEVLPMSAAFFSLFEDESAEQVLTITNTQQQPVKLGPPAARDAHFVPTLKVLEPGKRYELLIYVPSHVKPGRYRESVEFTTDDPARPRLRIPVNVLVKTTVYVNPEAVDFGRVPLTDMENNPRLLALLTQTVLVKKRGNQNFRITRVDCDVPSVKITRDPPSNASGTHRLDVTLATTDLKVGMLNGKIVIETDDQDFARLVIPVTGELY